MSSADRYRIPARAEGLVSREVDGGFVVLDPETDQAHHLHGLAADVWHFAGQDAPEELDREAVEDTAVALLDLGLLATPSFQPSRRSLLRVGGIAAAAAGVAGVDTIALPSAAWAVSANSSFTAGTYTQTTAGTYTIKVPDYAKTLQFAISGAGGGGAPAASGDGQSGNGGAGARIEGVITLPTTGRTSGFTTFTIYVGAPGIGGNQSRTAANTFGAGGAGYSAGGGGGNWTATTAGTAGGGGGASAIVAGGTVLVVAGGGGGGGRSRGGIAGGNGGPGGLLNTDGSSPTTTSSTVNVPTAIAMGNTLSFGNLAGFSTGQDTVSINSTNAASLTVGDWVVFGANGVGISQGTFYRVLTITGSGNSRSFQLQTANQAANAAVVNITGNNPPAMSVDRQAVVSFTAGSSTVRFNQAVTFTANQIVQFTGLTGGTGFSANTNYYFVGTPGSTTTASFSASSGGPVISPTTSGYATGANTITPTTVAVLNSNGVTTTGASPAVGGGGGRTSTTGTATGGTGGTGNSGGDGSAGTASVTAGAGAGGLGGANSGSDNRGGGGGGGGYAGGGGGEAGVSGSNSGGAGGGGGSSYYPVGGAAGYSLSSVVSLGGSAGGAGASGSANADGSNGTAGSVIISILT